MKYIINLLLLCALCPFAAAATVYTKNEAYYHGKLSGATTSTVILNEKYFLPLEGIKELSFSMLPAAERDLPSIIKETQGRYDELNAMAAKIEEQYPDSEAAIIFYNGFYNLKEDGTWTYSYTMAVKLLKESATDRFKSFSDYFEEGRDIISVRKASVYFPDGTVYPFQSSNFRTVSPQSAEGFFAQASGVEYTFPILLEGAIIEYQIELKKEKPFREDFFFPKWNIVNSYPIGSSEFYIEVPADKKLYYSTRNIDKKFSDPKIEKSTAAVKYVWRLDDIAPVFAEPYMPSLYDYMPQIKAALFADWNPVYDWLGPLYEERTQPDDLLIKKAKEITSGAKSEDEKIAALYHYVQRSIRYSAVKMGISSTWAGYHAGVTFDRKYGCCLDKAILFGAFLKAVGIESSVVLLDPNDMKKHNMDIPDIDFAHVITRIKKNGKDLFLDSTTYDYTYPYMHSLNYGTDALSVTDRETVNTGLPEKNEMNYSYDIKISTKNSAYVLMKANFAGPSEGERREFFSSLSYPRRMSFLNSIIGSNSANAVLLGHMFMNMNSLTGPFGFSLEYMLGDYLINAGDLAIFGLPDLEQSFSEGSLKTREYPIDYTLPYTHNVSYTIQFPKNLKLEALPENIKLENKHAAYVFRCRPKPGLINCEGKTQINSKIIPVEDYAQYREFLKRAVRHTREKIFFKRTEPAL